MRHPARRHASAARWRPSAHPRPLRELLHRALLLRRHLHPRPATLRHAARRRAAARRYARIRIARYPSGTDAEHGRSRRIHLRKLRVTGLRRRNLSGRGLTPGARRCRRRRPAGIGGRQLRRVAVERRRVDLRHNATHARILDRSIVPATLRHPRPWRQRPHRRRARRRASASSSRRTARRRMVSRNALVRRERTAIPRGEIRRGIWRRDVSPRRRTLAGQPSRKRS